MKSPWKRSEDLTADRNVFLSDDSGGLPPRRLIGAYVPGQAGLGTAPGGADSEPAATRALSSSVFPAAVGARLAGHGGDAPFAALFPAPDDV